MEESKELQMVREFPSLLERKQMMLQKQDLTEVKMLSSPPAGVKETASMFFILIDSFGIEMHPKYREAADAALKGNAPIRTKVNRVDAALSWAIIKA